MLYPVLYKVYSWDEIAGSAHYCYGVTLAESYADAIMKIEEYYGDTIMEISLIQNEDCSIYEFDIEDKYLKEYIQQATAN